MAVETDDTLDTFFSVNDFGVEATFEPFIGSAVTVTGIFDNPYLAADAGGMVEFTATSPTFVTKTSSLPDIDYGDALTIDGKDYVIKEIMPDGTGMTTLSLEA